MRYPDGTTETTEYDAEGRVSARTDRSGVRRTMTYDHRGRLVGTHHPALPGRSPTSETQVYDAAGRLTRTIDPGVTGRPASLHRLGYGHWNPMSNSDPSGYFVGGMVEMMSAVSMVATVWPPGHPGHTFWDLKDILAFDAWLGDMAMQAAPYVTPTSGSRCDNESPFGEFGLSCFNRTSRYVWQWVVGGYGPGSVTEDYRAGLTPGVPSALIDLDFVYLTEHGGEAGWFKVTHPGRHRRHQRRFQDRADLTPATAGDLRFVADFVTALPHLHATQACGCRRPDEAQH